MVAWLLQLTKPFSDVAGLCSALPPPPTDSPHTPPTERRLDRDDALEPTPSTQVALFIVPWPAICAKLSLSGIVPASATALPGPRSSALSPVADSLACNC